MSPAVCVGVLEFVLFPVPSWPQVLEPHVRRRPSSDRHMVWDAPHATCRPPQSRAVEVFERKEPPTDVAMRPTELSHFPFNKLPILFHLSVSLPLHYHLLSLPRFSFPHNTLLSCFYFSPSLLYFLPHSLLSSLPHIPPSLPSPLSFSICSPEW